jgi:hypothetical protein
MCDAPMGVVNIQGQILREHVHLGVSLLASVLVVLDLAFLAHLLQQRTQKQPAMIYA